MTDDVSELDNVERLIEAYQTFLEQCEDPTGWAPTEARKRLAALTEHRNRIKLQKAIRVVTDGTDKPTKRMKPIEIRPGK